MVHVVLHTGDYLKNLTPSIDLNSLERNSLKTKQSIKDYITFVANYICSTIRRQRVELFFKENLDKLIVDLITVSNDAFAIILVEDDTEKWIDQAKKERDLKENGFIARQPNREPVEMKSAKWTVALNKRKKFLYVDNWSREGKNRYNKVKKKLQKIRVIKSIHKAHVKAWHEWDAHTNIYPTAWSQNKSDGENYDPATHGRMNITMEPAKLPLTATGENDCGQIFEI